MKTIIDIRKELEGVLGEIQQHASYFETADAIGGIKRALEQAADLIEDVIITLEHEELKESNDEQK